MNKLLGMAVLIFALALAGAAMAQKETRGVTKTEIVMGMHTDLSGPAATYGVSSSNAVKMRFDEANEKGGVHGRKIKLIVEDTQYQVPRAVQGPARRRRAEPLPALGRALDVRAVPPPEVLRRRHLRRPGPRRHQLLRDEEGEEGGLRHVP